jgi:vitamin B12 transporter
LNANRADYQEDNFSPGIAPGVLTGVPPVETHSQYKRSNVSVLNTLFVSKQTTLGFGAEIVDEKGEINSVIDFGFPLPADFKMSRDTWAIFGEASYSAEHYTVLGSVRHDDIETVSSTNVRLATEFDIQKADTKFWLSYSEGFKMPSMFALGHSLTGNPDLVPEQSTSYSGTVEKSFTAHDANISLTLYKNTFKNLVDFDAESFLHVNRDSAQTKGVELSGQAALSSTLMLSGFVAYLETSVSDGSKLEHRPKWKSGLELSWRWTDDLLFNLSGYGNDGAYSLSVPTGLATLDGYVRVDAGLQWQFSDGYLLKFQVDNLFDSDYEEVVGFSSGGRQGRIALTATL